MNATRMNSPIVLLLDRYEENATAVGNVLSHMEEQRIISVQYHKRNALGFAADITPAPSALVMYLDRSELVSIMFTENAYLLPLHASGALSMGRQFEQVEVQPAGDWPGLNLVQFLNGVFTSSPFNLCVDN